MSTQQMPLSYSRINTYRTCPRQFDYMNVSKVITFKETEATKLGKEIHRELELYCKNELTKQELKATQDYTDIADKIKKLSGSKYYEQQIAFDHNYTETEYYSKTGVFMRSIIDVLVVNGESAQVIDWKSGKHRPSKEQFELELFTLAVFIKYPNVQRIKTSLIYLKDKKIESQIYSRNDIDRIKSELEKYKTKIYNDLEVGSFKAKPSPLCNWCGGVDICDRK